MPLFVIADERHRGNAVNLADEWVLENKMPKAFVAVTGAKVFQIVARASVVCDRLCFARGLNCTAWSRIGFGV
ncbi:MAG TPA: hypothetical protein DC047_16185 [Blastocatellia bacterium]|nr:hypothetical protein [Blastocatellia bacterium]